MYKLYKNILTDHGQQIIDSVLLFNFNCICEKIDKIKGFGLLNKLYAK